MQHLYFVRHGLSVKNKEGVFSGRTETPLAPEGIEQAEAAGRQAKALDIDLIITSPMDRARETAALIAEQIGYPVTEIRTSDLFIERAFGVLEGTPYQSDMHLEDYEGVEKTEDIITRAREGLKHLENMRYDNILIVSHGAIGRALRNVLHPNIPFRGSEKFENGKIVQLL